MKCSKREKVHLNMCLHNNLMVVINLDRVLDWLWCISWFSWGIWRKQGVTCHSILETGMLWDFMLLLERKLFYYSNAKLASSLTNHWLLVRWLCLFGLFEIIDKWFNLKKWVKPECQQHFVVSLMLLCCWEIFIKRIILIT